MYKIYINDSPLLLCSTEDLQNLRPGTLDLTFLYTRNKKRLLNVIDMLEKGSRYNRIIIYFDDIDQLWKDFKSVNKLIIAGGGLVFSNNGNILVIFRKGRWDLPKGKIEKGETNKKGAKREVKEECGISKITILKKAHVTYHLYKIRGKRMLKKTIWYFMQTEEQVLTPQAKEGIEKAIWIAPEVFLNEFKTHANIRAFLEDVYFKKIRI